MASYRQRAGLQIIRDEHASIAAMLHAIGQMLRRGPVDNPERFFDVLRAMLFYIDEFPEKRHHRKESEVLFPKLARVAPETVPVIESLEREHHSGHDRVRELQHQLLAWEFLGDSRRQAFEEAATKYVGFYLNHMKVEETQLLPVAARCLSKADLAELDLVFRENPDPLAGQADQSDDEESDEARDAMYDRLFSLIVLRAPAPVGVGPD